MKKKHGKPDSRIGYTFPSPPIRQPPPVLHSHFIIPDVHSDPRYDHKRLSALGKYVVEARPSHIICLGDFGEFGSLSHFDKGKKSFEGRRYRADLDSFKRGMEAFLERIRGASGYRPALIFCLGNHENRINRIIDDDARLDGTISIGDLELERYGWWVIPYQTPYIVDGIAYCHNFASGVNGKPISGDSIGRSLCLKLHNSAVVGHSHLFSHYESNVIGERRIFGLSAGCFVHPEMCDGWSDATRRLWWRGVVMLRDVSEGYYDSMEAITMRKILRDFG